MYIALDLCYSTITRIHLERLLICGEQFHSRSAIHPIDDCMWYELTQSAFCALID